MTEIIEIPCNQIIPGSNDRKVFDQARLEELAASINEHSLAQPITVRPMGEVFQIIAGERRFRTISQVLKRPTVPCIVRQMNDEEASAIMLAENTGREDLNSIEEANAYRVRIERFGWTPARVAQTAGVSEDLVKRRISLLKLVAEAQHLVAFGHLPIGHAEALVGLDANRQRIALRIFQESKGMTLAQFRHIVSELFAEQSQDSLFDLQNFWIQQVQTNELPRRGRHAFTGAPVRQDLPPVESHSASENTAVIIDRWIASLLERGYRAEAETVGVLYDSLVKLNYLAVPPNSMLVGKGEL